jgi:hypothetical protein
MQSCSPNATPLSPSAQLSSKQAAEQPLGDGTDYRQIVGSLLYLSTSTRPDIAFAANTLARFNAAPSKQHLQAAKATMRYLAGTASMGLQFSAAAQHELEAFCDADWAGCPDTFRSTSGYVFRLNGAAISWSSKRQSTVALSTAEAEYMAAAWAVCEALFLRKLDEDLPLLRADDYAASGVSLPLFVDNQAAVALLCSPQQTQRSKHISVQLAFAREAAERQEVSVHYIPSQEQVADAMTKALPATKIGKAQQSLGLASA